MKYIRITWISLLIFLSMSPLANAQHSEVADKAAELVAEQDWKDLLSMSSATLKKNISSKTLKETWANFENLMGDYDRYKWRSAKESADGDVVSSYYFYFEKATLEFIVRENTNGEIAGLNFLPLTYQLPERFNGQAFWTEKMTIKSGDLELPGELMLPATFEKCPVVILVHGSGPNDRDETIGPNKVFLDLAMMLAEQGVATFRYDKRSMVYPQYFDDRDSGDLTLDDYTVEDALNAIKLVKTNSLIDTNRIFVLGHSLGAMAAPEIAARDTTLAGVIMAAGPVSDLSSLLLQQYRYIYTEMTGPPSFREKRLIKMVSKSVRAVKSGDFKSGDTRLLGPWGPAFWTQMREYSAANEAMKSNVPVMVCYGSRDYQVPAKNYVGTWDSLGFDSTMSDRWYKVYDGLNHLFIYGGGKPNRGEYLEPAHISEVWVRDIVSWIQYVGS